MPLFEKILELLAALAVAAAGSAGIDTAAEHATPPANAAALTQAAEAFSRAADTLAELDAVGPTGGLTTAAEALTSAAEHAPDEAETGLDQAMESVTEAPANDAPAGPPTDLPGGRP
jgi:hypothetical protein